ncbi:MAG TPA: hypothetical protein VFO11_10010, partial [Candidatus Polarisedimenticolaceae bacterium]|nr:hypothetical protein [Candidatus Polarisedimenticolaceae bacterium]
MNARRLVRGGLASLPLVWFALTSPASAAPGAPAKPAPPAVEHRPDWPSLEAQLKRDQVRSGSALEALIRSNQDFHLLRPEEVEDKIPVPAWLRVVWRKAHPELVYSADDPTGGYPHVLKEIHEWMVRHQDLSAALDADLEADPDAPVEPETAGGANLRISGSSTTPRAEQDIRINYWNTNKVVAAANNLGGTGRQAQFWSTDGGSTWGQTTLS